MHLREGEVILRVIRRHPTPYLFTLIGIGILATPLYWLLFLIRKETDADWVLSVFAVLSFFVGIIIASYSLDYLLDKLVISNKRVIWVNWRSIIHKEEHEAELNDIQDIEVREMGILSKLKIFDYGLLEIETAATKTAIQFKDCPDPEEVHHFIITQTERLRKATGVEPHHGHPVV